MFCTFPHAPILSNEVINLTSQVLISAKLILQCVTKLVIHLLLFLSLAIEHLIIDFINSAFWQNPSFRGLKTILFFHSLCKGGGVGRKEKPTCTTVNNGILQWEGRRKRETFSILRYSLKKCIVATSWPDLSKCKALFASSSVPQFTSSNQVSANSGLTQTFPLHVSMH